LLFIQVGIIIKVIHSKLKNVRMRPKSEVTIANRSRDSAPAIRMQISFELRDILTLILCMYNIYYSFFQSLVAFPKLKKQVLLYVPEAQSPKDFDELSSFWINQDFALM